MTQSESMATGGTSGTPDGNTISTGGVYTSVGGTNIPSETGSEEPTRLETKGFIADFTAVSHMTDGMTVQGEHPGLEPSEGYMPPRKLWNDVDKHTIEEILRSARRDNLGFEDFHDSVQFIDDQAGEIARIHKPDGDRFRALLDDDYFRTLLDNQFDDAMDIAVTKFPSFTE